jgi:hypothetical protein
MVRRLSAQNVVNGCVARVKKEESKVVTTWHAIAAEIKHPAILGGNLIGRTDLPEMIGIKEEVLMMIRVAVRDTGEVTGGIALVQIVKILSPGRAHRIVKIVDTKGEGWIRQGVLLVEVWQLWPVRC